MASYLITGRSGTGKSTVCKELLKRGYVAFDGDSVPGLAGWVDIATGQKVNTDYPGHDHVGKFNWNWDETVLKKLLQDNEDVFLCGSANNAYNFYPLFDTVFVLNLEPDEQRRRINNRVEHDYGKDLAVQDSIIAYQKESVEVARNRGATIVDSMPPVDQIVSDILSRIK